MEPEIKIENVLDDPLEQSCIKEESILKMFDHADDDKNSEELPEENLIFFKREVINSDSENDLINFEESFVKEESMISDMSENERSNDNRMLRNNTLFRDLENSNNQLPGKENIRTTYATKRKSDDEETVVNFDKADEMGENRLMECTKCGGKYKNSLTLRMHFRLCGLEPFLNCQFCQFKTKFRKSMIRHLKCVHKDLKVGETQMALDRAVNVERELIGKSDSSKYEVATVSKRFSTKDFVKLYCSSCDENFVNIANLKDRSCRRCGRTSHLRCLKCQKLYASSDGMHAHLRRKCQPIEYFQCPDCEYRSVLRSQLHVHVQRRHIAVAPGDYDRCPKCDRGFKLPCDLRWHEKICDVGRDSRADFGEREKGSLKVDKGRHEAVEPTGPGVPKPMSEKEKLKVQKLIKAYCPSCRVKTASTEDSRACPRCAVKFYFHCAACACVYALQSDLRLHVARKHLAGVLKKRQQCLKCGKRFVLFSDLSNHHSYCSREASFRCEQCPYKSKYRVCLEKHVEARHRSESGGQLWTCRCCGRGYKGPAGLAQHERFYCGKEPGFECAHCEHSSYTKTNLMAHLRRTHAELFKGA